MLRRALKPNTGRPHQIKPAVSSRGPGSAKTSEIVSVSASLTRHKTEAQKTYRRTGHELNATVYFFFIASYLRCTRTSLQVKFAAVIQMQTSGERFVRLHVTLKMPTLSLPFRHPCGILVSHLIRLFIALPSLPGYLDFPYCTRSNVIPVSFTKQSNARFTVAPNDQ